jgi:hypothetical protein
MSERSQRNYDARRQNADMGALHVEQVGCKFARLMLNPVSLESAMRVTQVPDARSAAWLT